MNRDLSNWDLLAFFSAGAFFYWAALQVTPVARTARRLRDAKTTRLSNRLAQRELDYRKAARERDEAQMVNHALRAENEHLTTDLAIAVGEAQDARRALARTLHRPSTRTDEATLFAQLEQDFADRNGS